MPAPIGGAFALHMRRHSSADSAVPDPELEEFREQQKYIQENLWCAMKFYRNVIPPGKWKLEGEMVLEAREDIEHSGVFVLMKGLPVDPKKRMERMQVSNVKFTVVESTHIGGEDGGEYMMIDKEGKEVYPMEFEIPEELPPPLITAEGKLIFRMQAFISTVERRHVKVGEAPVRWMPGRELKREEIDKELVIEQHVSCRRTFLVLGRKKSCGLEWRIPRGGYLPGEVIQLELLGESRDDGGMEVECLVELVQKVWYQVPSRSNKGKMWDNLKVNVLASEGSDEAFEVGESGEKKVVWAGRLKIPKMITPTKKFEDMNSVSYTIRVKVGAAGESKEHWVKGEVPILIGTSKEMKDGEEDEVDGGDEEDEEEELYHHHHRYTPSQTNSRRGSVTNLHVESPLQRRGSLALPSSISSMKRSNSMAHMTGPRPRAGSVTTMGSCEFLASNTLQICRVPPSVSQESLRRLALDHLHPSTCEQGFKEPTKSSSQPTTPPPE